MVERITSFRSSSGKIFDTEHAAQCDELITLLTTSQAINEASAGQLVKMIAAEDIPGQALIETIQRVIETAPHQPQVTHDPAA